MVVSRFNFQYPLWGLKHLKESDTTAVLTSLVVLPLGPLFLQGICSVGVEAAYQGQTASLATGDAPGGVVSGSPLFDWVMCGFCAQPWLQGWPGSGRAWPGAPA
eukprot:s164_g21.t1